MTDSPLAHLDAATQRTLIDRYYAGEKVAVLLKTFGVACGAKRLVDHFPPEITNQPCPVCGAPLLRPRDVRQVRRGRPANRPLRCGRCPHVEVPTCDCPACRQARMETEGTRAAHGAIALLCQNYRDNAVSDLQPDALTADAALALLTLVRCGGWRDASTLGSLHAAPIPFGALGGRYLTDPLLTALVDQSLAAPSPTSPREAFEQDPQGEWIWKMEQVEWTLLLSDARGWGRPNSRVTSRHFHVDPALTPSRLPLTSLDRSGQSSY